MIIRNLFLLVLHAFNDIIGTFVQAALKFKLVLLATLTCGLTHLNLLVIAWCYATVAGWGYLLLLLHYETSGHYDSLRDPWPWATLDDWLRNDGCREQAHVWTRGYFVLLSLGLLRLWNELRWCLHLFRLYPLVVLLAATLWLTFKLFCNDLRLFEDWVLVSGALLVNKLGHWGCLSTLGQALPIPTLSDQARADLTLHWFSARK